MILSKVLGGFYKLPPIIKTLIVLILLSVLLLATHDILFVIDRKDIRSWFFNNFSVNLVLTTFNTTLLFSVLATVNKEKGENTVKHKESEKRIKIVHHHSKSTTKKLEIMTRKVFALEAKLEILEDVIFNKRQSHNENI